MKGKLLPLVFALPFFFVLLLKLFVEFNRLGPLKFRGPVSISIVLLLLLNLYFLLRLVTLKGNALAVLFILISFLTVFHLQWMAPYRVESDGVGYFSYLRSAVYDRDLDFENEFTQLQAQKFGIGRLVNGKYKRLKKTGLISNPFSVGPALLWSGFYLTAKLITRGKTGYEPPLLRSVALSHWVLALLGSLLLFFSLRRFLDPLFSLLALEGILLASPLFHYLRHNPFLSHIPSFFSLSLFIFLLLRSSPESPPMRWFLPGAASGLAALVRWQNGIFVLLPASYLTHSLLKSRISVRRYILSGLGFGAGFFLLLIPQLLVFKEIYGGFFTVPQGKKFLSYLPLYLPQSLFSPFHGLFNWHPLLLAGLLGFFLPWDKEISIRNLNLGGFSLAALGNGFVKQFWAGASFGARRYIGSLGFLSFGLGNFFKRMGLSLSLLLLFSFFLLNSLAEAAYNLNLIPHEVPYGLIKIISTVVPRATQLLQLKTALLYLLYLFLLLLVSKQLARKEVNL